MNFKEIKIPTHHIIRQAPASTSQGISLYDDYAVYVKENNYLIVIKTT